MISLTLGTVIGALVRLVVVGGLVVQRLRREAEPTTEPRHSRGRDVLFIASWMVVGAVLGTAIGNAVVGLALDSA